MAGVPDPVVERSRALVEGTNGHDDGMQVTLGAVNGIEAGEGTATDDGVAATLRDADLARTTPIEALNLLAELKDRVEES
jgi:DNA mismatch repair protein MutS